MQISKHRVQYLYIVGSSKGNQIQAKRLLRTNNTKQMQFIQVQLCSSFSVIVFLLDLYKYLKDFLMINKWLLRIHAMEKNLCVCVLENGWKHLTRSKKFWCYMCWLNFFGYYIPMQLVPNTYDIASQQPQFLTFPKDCTTFIYGLVGDWRFFKTAFSEICAMQVQSAIPFFLFLGENSKAHLKLIIDI